MTQYERETQRFKTGEKCTKAGKYEFDGYTDGTNLPSPTANERIIPMDYGDTFPPVKSTDKGAWWRFLY